VSTEIYRIDLHEEIPPSGGLVVVPHCFRARPRGSQTLLLVGGEPVLLEGDKFDNEAVPDHKLPKTGGSFKKPPRGKGKFTRAGQKLLKIKGKAAIVRNGQLETCNDIGPEETSCRSVTAISCKPLLIISGSGVLTGR
jgi:hypothetical protein